MLSLIILKNRKSDVSTCMTTTLQKISHCPIPDIKAAKKTTTTYNITSSSLRARKLPAILIWLSLAAANSRLIKADSPQSSRKLKTIENPSNEKYNP